MLLSIEGEEATIKTTMAYTAPWPIVGFQFDLGEERALYGAMYDKYFKNAKINIVKYDRLGENKPTKQWDGYDITIYQLPQPISLSSNLITGHKALYDYFITLLGLAVSDSNIQSIVVDTMTLARSVKADAYLEELNQKGADRRQLLQIEYGHPNEAIRSLYSLMKACDKNFIAIHHLRDGYAPQMIKGEIQSVPTGERVLDGLDKTLRFVDVAIRNVKKGSTINSVFVKCGYNLDLEGGSVPGNDWNSIVTIINMSRGDRMPLPMNERLSG